MRGMKWSSPGRPTWYITSSWRSSSKALRIRRRCLPARLPVDPLELAGAPRTAALERVQDALGILHLVQRRRPFGAGAATAAGMHRVAFELLDLAGRLVDVGQQPAGRLAVEADRRHAAVVALDALRPGRRVEFRPVVPLLGVRTDRQLPGASHVAAAFVDSSSTASADRQRLTGAHPQTSSSIHSPASAAMPAPIRAAGMRRSRRTPPPAGWRRSRIAGRTGAHACRGRARSGAALAGTRLRALSERAGLIAVRQLNAATGEAASREARTRLAASGAGETRGDRRTGRARRSRPAPAASRRSPFASTVRVPRLARTARRCRRRSPRSSRRSRREPDRPPRATRG